MAQHPERSTTALGQPRDIYERLVQSVLDYAIFMLDPQGNITTWSAGAQLLKGYTADEAIGSHFSRFYPPEKIAAGWPEHELKVAAIEGRFEDEGIRVRKDGTTFLANVVITAIRDDGGELIGFAKVTRDLTERVRQEQSLRASEERFRALVDGVSDYAIFMLDTEGRIATWNPGAEKLKGYTAEEIIGSHISRFYPPDAVQRRWPHHELEVASYEGRFEDEGWRIRKDGSRFWANVVITALRNESGGLRGFAKITRDLTERRAHEEQLRRSEERFRLLVEGVAEYAIIMLDVDGKVSSWNVGAHRIHGYTTEEIVGRHFSRFYAAEDIQANIPWQDLRTARHEGRSARESWRQRNDGALFWAASSITPLYGADSTLYGFALTTQDLTERRNTETLAATAHRMSVFVAMLAHELRNPLAPIRNAVALMGAHKIDDPLIDSMRQTIDRQSAHLGRLIDDLLDANRIARDKLVVKRETIDVCAVVRHAIEASQPLLESMGHRLHTEIPPVPVLVHGDFLRLAQACVNLLNNAAKYTPKSGDVFVEVRAARDDVSITVRDTGIGIAAEDLSKVFDLFAQIQPSSHSAGGLGVGLALVQRVVQLHGGTVVASSDGPNRGSSFEIHMPRTPLTLKAVPEQPRTNEEAVEPTPALRIIVVDDNADAASSLSELLRTMGHHVRTVLDGEAALSLAAILVPDAILLDIGMPGMSGYQLAERARLLQPRPALVAVTGWGQPEDRSRSRQAGVDYHFVKPISEQQLRDLMAEIARQRLQGQRSPNE